MSANTFQSISKPKKQTQRIPPKVPKIAIKSKKIVFLLL